MAEKIERQRREIAFVVERREIEAVHRVPLARIELVAVLDLAGRTGAHRARTFAPDVLALLVVQCGEKIVEVAPVFVVLPVELPVEARQPAGAFERGRIARRSEVEMRRGQAEAA